MKYTVEDSFYNFKPWSGAVKTYERIINDHSGARFTIANWIVQQLRAHGFTMKDSSLRRAMTFYRLFEAIATIHAEIGHLPPEVYDLRYRRTEEMLDFVEKANPEAAEAIRKAL